MRKRLLGLLAGAGVLAALLVAPGIPHVFATGSPNWGPYYRTDLAPYSASCNGTDASGAINQAITDASGFGRGRVVIPPCATTVGNEPWGSPAGQFYGIANPIVPRPYVELDMWGAYFKWTGAATGLSMMANTCVSGVPLQHFDLYGGEFDGSTNTNVNGITLDSWQNSRLNGTEIRNVNGGGNRNGFHTGLVLTQGCGTTFMNHTHGNEVHSLHVDSVNIALSIAAGATNNGFYSLHFEDVTRNYVTISGDTDDLRFYDYTFQASATPGGPGQVNDGSWFLGVNFNSSTGHPTNGYLFDGGSMGVGTPSGVSGAAINCQAVCGGVILRHTWLDGAPPTTIVAGSSNFTSYWIEIITDSLQGIGGFLMKTYTHGYTTVAQ